MIDTDKIVENLLKMQRQEFQNLKHLQGKEEIKCKERISFYTEQINKFKVNDLGKFAILLEEESYATATAKILDYFAQIEKNFDLTAAMNPVLDYFNNKQLTV